jgi:hypothetical protein
LLTRGSTQFFNWFDVSALVGNNNTWFADNTTYYILFNFSATQTTIRLSKVKSIPQATGTTTGWTFSSYPVNIQNVFVGANTSVSPPFYFRGTINNIIFASSALTWDQAFGNAIIE